MEKVSNKNKLTLLFLFFISLLILFILKVGKPLEAKYSELSLKKKLKTSKINIANEINLYNEKIKNINNVIGGENFNENLLQQDILDFLLRENKEGNFDIFQIDPIHFFIENENLLISNSVFLKGDYCSLINIINKIELAYNKSKLCSVNFFISTQKNVKELQAHLIFQNFKKNKIE